MSTISQEILDNAARVVHKVMPDYIPVAMDISNVVARSAWGPDGDYVDVSVLIRDFDHQDICIPLYVKSFPAINKAITAAGIPRISMWWSRLPTTKNIMPATNPTAFDPDLIMVTQVNNQQGHRAYSVTYNGHMVGGITRRALGPRGKWSGFLITPDGGYERVAEDRRVEVVKRKVIQGVQGIYDAGNIVNPETNPLATVLGD